MVLYLIPLIFINSFLLIAAFRSLIMSILLNKRIYRIIAMISIGMYGYINCEVISDIIRYYYPIGVLKGLYTNPIYPLIVSLLIGAITYIKGTKWIEGYIIKLKKSD